MAQVTTSPDPSPPSNPLSVNDLLEQLKTSKLGEIKAEKVSSTAAYASRLNIEQTSRLKRLKLFTIISFILIFIFICIYIVVSAYSEYHDLVVFMNTYGPQAQIPLSGLKLALCLRYPPLTGWFYNGNDAFPEAVFIAYRSSMYHDAFVSNLPYNLTQLYSIAQTGAGCEASEDTSALYLVCCCDFAQTIKGCEAACNSSNSTNALTSSMNGLSTGFSTAVATSGIFPPFGMIGGFIAGFCLGFFPSQYPPGGSSGLNNCIS